MKKETCGKASLPEIPDISRALGSIVAPRWIPIYSPEAPVQGENSSAHPMHLGPGAFQRLQNLRFSGPGPDLRVRAGSQLMAAAVPTAGAVFRGAFVGVLDGTLQMFAAYRVSGATRVYRVNGITGTSFTYTEITNGSGTAATDETAGEAGTNNGTRFTADGFISFAIVSDGLGPTPADVLIFGNGTNAPRVYGSSRSIFGGSLSTTATCGTINPPADDTVFSTPDVVAYVDLKTSASTTVAATGAATLTKQTIAGEIYIEFVTGTATDTATITLAGGTPAWRHDSDYFVSSTSLRMDLGKQLILVVEDDVTNPVWRQCKITVNVAGTPVDVWDPTNPLFVQPFYYSLGGSKYLVAFNLEQSLVASTVATDFRFTITQALAVSRTVTIYGIMVGGNVPADSQYTISYIDSNSRSESPGVVALRKDPEKLSRRGCASAKVSSNIPIVDGLYLRHAITYPHSPISPRVDYAMLYRKEQDETTYTWVSVMGVPRSAFWINNSFYSDNIKSRSRYSNRTAPLGSTRSIPYSAYFLAANGRLVAGKPTGSIGELWISGDRTPFRFSSSASVTGAGTSRNPAYHRFQGEEVQGVTSLPGQYYGASPLLLFTNKRVYRIEGIDALSLSRATVVANVGCAWPRSIAEHNGQIYFVSSDGQVWRYGLGNDGAISYNVVDSRLASATLTACCASADLYGYRLSITEGADTTPKTVLRFDGVSGTWNSDYFSPGGVVGMVSYDVTGQRRNIVFCSSGEIYWFEKPGTTQDGTTDITARILTREFNGGMWQKGLFGKVGMVAEKPSGSSPVFTITRNGTVYGDTAVSTLDFTGVTTPRAYREDLNSAGPGVSQTELEDVGCVIDITGTVPGGMKFHSIQIQVSQDAEDPDVYRP